MASPWDVDLSDPWSVDLSDDDSEWETRGVVQVNRRTGEKRPAPSFQGGAPGLGKAEDPYTGIEQYTAGIPQVAVRIAESAARLPEFATKVAEFATNHLTATPLQVDMGPASDVYGHGKIREVRDALGRKYEEKKDELAQHFAATGQSPVQSALADTGLEGIAIVGDPTNFIPWGKGARALGFGEKVLAEEGPRVAARAAKADPLAQVFAELQDELAAEQRNTLGAAATRGNDAKILAARPDPREVLTQKLDEAGRSVAELERMAGKGPKVTAVEAAASPDLGINALPEGERLYVVKGKDGKDVGSLIVQPGDDGFRVRHVFVEEGARGKGVPEDLYRAAHRDLGTYLGSTDYQGRRTPAGEAMAGRLRKTAPEIFEPPPSDPGFARLVVGDDLKLAQTEQRRLAKLQGKGQELDELDSPAGFGRLAEGPELQAKIDDYQARLPGAILGDDTLFRLDPNAGATRARPALAAAVDEPVGGVIPGVRRRRGGAVPYAGKPTLSAEPAESFRYSLDRLDLSDDFKDEVGRVLHGELRDKLPAAGGGTITGLQGKLADPKVIDSLSLKLGLTPEELAKKRPGFVLDTSGAAVLDAGLTSTTNKMQALATDIAGGKVAPADLAAKTAELADLRYKRNLLVIASSGNASEQGRALGARRFKIPGLSDEDALRAQINRKYTLSPEQIDALAKLDPTRPEDVNLFLRMVDTPGLGHMVTSLWRASIMSGIPTQLRNILGNTTQLAFEVINYPLAAGIEQGVLSKLAGRAPTKRVQDIVPAFVGMYDGGKAGFGKALQVLKTGMTADSAGKLETRLNSFELVQNPILRNLGKAATEPVYRTLSAVDTFFRTVGWTSKQYEAAARLAAQEGKPLAEMMIDPRVLSEADGFAKRITYTDTPSKFAQGVASAAKGLDELTGIPIGTFAVPFTSVPDRVMARAFEATPAGLMRAAWKAAKKDPQAADGLAKGALGTAVAYWAYEKAKDGLLTAGAPTDAAERSQFYQLGAQPWSMKVGDRWVPYSQLGPLGFTMAMSAQVAEYNSQTGDDDSIPDQLLSAGMGAANYVLDQSYVDNLQKLTETLGSNDNLDSRKAKLARFVDQTAAGFVPYSALQRNIAQATDQRVTDPKTLGQTIAANTPGLSGDVPAKLTPWGGEVTRQETPLGAFLPRNTPLYALAQKETPADPVEAEMARIGYALPFALKTVGSEKRGTRRPLSQDEWRSFQEDSGQAIHSRLETLLNSPTYAALNDVQRLALVKQYVELERKRSRIKLFGP